MSSKAGYKMNGQRCTCRCHKPGTRVKHIMPCCHPLTDEQAQLLREKRAEQKDNNANT